MSAVEAIPFPAVPPVDPRAPVKAILELLALSGVRRAEAAAALGIKTNNFSMWLNFANGRPGQQVSMSFGTAQSLLDFIAPALRERLPITATRKAAIIFKLMEADRACAPVMDLLRAQLRFNVDREFEKLLHEIDAQRKDLPDNYDKENASLRAAIGATLRRGDRDAERVERMKKTIEVQHDQLEAAARRPRDRDELARRLRDGTF